MAGLIIFVIQFLKLGLAMTLCCIAKTPSRSKLINNAWRKGAAIPELIDFGTIKPPTKPIAYKKEIRKIKYATIP